MLLATELEVVDLSESDLFILLPIPPPLPPTLPTVLLLAVLAVFNAVPDVLLVLLCGTDTAAPLVLLLTIDAEVEEALVDVEEGPVLCVLLLFPFWNLEGDLDGDPGELVFARGDEPALIAPASVSPLELSCVLVPVWAREVSTFRLEKGLFWVDLPVSDPLTVWLLSIVR